MLRKDLNTHITTSVNNHLLVVMQSCKGIKEELRKEKEEITKIKKQLATTEQKLAKTEQQMAKTEQKLSKDLKNTKEQLYNSDENLRQANKQLKQIGIEWEFIKQQLKEKYKVELIEARKPSGYLCKLIFNFNS